MIDLEIPIGKRTRWYRFFEILPAVLSYGAIVLLITLSIINPFWAAVYLLIIIMTMLIKAIVIAYHTIRGRSNSESAQRVDWHQRLQELESPAQSYKKYQSKGLSKAFGVHSHVENLRLMAVAEEGFFPKPSELYNALIMPAYNEDIAVIEPSLCSVLDSTYDLKRLIVVFAYEERGGAAIAQTAQTLQKRYSKNFHSFHIVKHPKDLPNEVIGKGGNITYAGRYLERYLRDQQISLSNVIVTTMDCDNKPHPKYFDYLTYEYIVHEDRKHLSYQPICLFTNNIWDVPAPMRVIATGNSFWNIISSMRPHTLRNFASHAQPMDALVEMDFWSTRTIVEDGHQYWRSYFHFNGNYAVTPLFVPIYQDAVLSSTYVRTLKAQFVQLRRWAYGVSDVPYVAARLFNRNRTVPFFEALARFIRLLDGHVTLATVAILVAFGGWVPLIINTEAARNSIIAHQLPDTISIIQRVAMIGLFITVFLSFKMLPPRPERYKRHRSFFMLAQWVLMPVTSVVYSASSALYSQWRLARGRYLDKFDVTEKVTIESVNQEKAKKTKRTK